MPQTCSERQARDCRWSIWRHPKPHPLETRTSVIACAFSLLCCSLYIQPRLQDVHLSVHQPNFFILSVRDRHCHGEAGTITAPGRWYLFTLTRSVRYAGIGDICFHTWRGAVGVYGKKPRRPQRKNLWHKLPSLHWMLVRRYYIIHVRLLESRELSSPTGIVPSNEHSTLGLGHPISSAMISRALFSPQYWR